MRRFIMIGVFFALFSINTPVFALDVSSLTVTTSGLNVSLSWTSVTGATGYDLIYAPYPYSGPSSIVNIDLGTSTSLSVDLWDGASFYIAVKAYNSYGTSGFSNIELIKMDSGKYQLGVVQAIPQGLNIDLISGSAFQCYDYSSLDLTNITNMTQCIIGCGDDPSCMTGCYSNFSFMPESFSYLTMTLTNSTSTAITITLDAGTAFVPGSSDTQTMIIAKVIDITIPAMGTITECVPVFCIDSALSSPGDSDIFQISGIAYKTCLQEILTKVEGKTVANSGQLQTIIWNCVDPSTAVSQAEWDWLNALP